MAGTKLELLRLEISKYIGLPYHTNVPKLDSPEAAIVGKGNAREIALKTIEFANEEKIKLIDLNPQQIYNFQKKHHLGIDCSGLACHLLNLYFETKLNVRQTSANMLSSAPLSKKIPITGAKTGDLIRQKSGHHVLFIVEKTDNQIIYVDSSLKGRGVRYGQFDITDKSFKYDDVYRLLLLN